jgi:hypothetical protein
MPHRESATFTIQLELSAEFTDDYEGDDDGGAWLERWRREAKPQLLRAVFDALRRDGQFEVMPAARGTDTDRAAEFAVRLRVGEVSR